MKKRLCVLLVFAVIFCLAACGKESKGEIYTPPHTEVITFEDGESAVYEVMTDAKGEPVTDAEGLTELVPYDPPVTEKDGVIVTTPEGETIKQSQTTVAQSVAVDQDLVDLDTTAAIKDNTTTAKGETTVTAAPQTTVDSTGGALVPPGEEKTTAFPEIQEGETHPLNGNLSKEDAQKLFSILSIANPFDTALSEGDYHKAEEQLPVYLDNIDQAIAQIKADKKLYQYVGNKNLQLWRDYMTEAADRYAIFMGVLRGIESNEGIVTKAFYTTYEDFQEYYRYSLEVFYHMRLGAEIIMYS